MALFIYGGARVGAESGERLPDTLTYNGQNWLEIVEPTRSYIASLFPEAQYRAMGYTGIVSQGVDGDRGLAAFLDAKLGADWIATTDLDYSKKQQTYLILRRSGSNYVNVPNLVMGGTKEDRGFWNNGGSILFKAFTAGADSALDGAQAASDLSSASEGATMFDDFGISSPDDSFDPFGFSSGEATVAFSDAEWVDFGFSPPDTLPDLTGGNGIGSGELATYGDPSFEFGTTPEVSTNDFGTQFEKSFGDDSIQTAVKGVKLAKQGESIGKALVGKKASGGTNGAKQQIQGSNDALSSFGQVFQSVGNIAASISSTSPQKTINQKQTFSGQLAPGGAVPPAMFSTPALLTIGVVILGIGFFIVKGKA